MSNSYDVYGIGNAIVDLQFSVLDDVITAQGLSKGEMKLVDSSEQEKLLSLVSVHEVHQASGGSAANTMIALAQLGGSGAYGCLVGDDTFGQFYSEEMSVLGIKLHNPLQYEATTGSCVILITPDAERTMNTNLGVSAEFSEEHVSEDLIDKAKWLYIEGYLFSSDKGQAAVKKAISVAKKTGTKIAVTFSDGFIIDVFGDSLREAVKDADLVFANLNEAEKFTGSPDEQEMFASLKKQVSNVALTRSERGALLHLDGKDITAAPFPTKPVDATGAGDIFAGGLLYGITNDLSADSAARLACFLGSKVVSQLGPRLTCNVSELVETNNVLKTGTNG